MNELGDISKKTLLINIALSQAILFLIAFLSEAYMPDDLSLIVLLRKPLTVWLLVTIVSGSILLLLIQLVFLKVTLKHHLMDEMNILLLEKLSIKELALIFLSGAIVEEWLFRGILQTYLGVLLSSLIFTAIHFRYLNKIVLLFEVLLMGLILGLSYHVTSSLLVPIVCHFIVNTTTAFLCKKGYIDYKI